MPEPEVPAHDAAWYLAEAIAHYAAADRMASRTPDRDADKITRRLLAASAAAQIATAQQGEHLITELNYLQHYGFPTRESRN